MGAISQQARDEARKLAPGHSIESLEREWRKWSDARADPVIDPDAAFIAYCRRKGTHKSKLFKSSPLPKGYKPPADLAAAPGEVSVCRGSPAWQAWLDYIEKRHPDIARAMRGAFVVFTATPWPEKGSPPPRVPASMATRLAFA